MTDPGIPSVNDLGVIIGNSTARKTIYGLYVLALLTVGAIQVALAAVQIPQPSWLVAALAVLAYLGIPVGGLAAANTTRKG